MTSEEGTGAFAPASDMRWTELPWIAVDVETTGLDSSSDRVIEVGIVRLERGEVVEQYGRIVNPGREVSDEVIALTGIAREEIEAGPPFEAIAPEVYERLAAGITVAYNLNFDRAFLRRELEMAGLGWPEVPALDPLVFARQLLPGGSKKLGEVARRLGVVLEEAHRAVHDAEAAGKVLWALRERLPASLGELEALQAAWAAEQERRRAAWRRRRDAGDDTHLLGAGSDSLAVDPATGLPALGPAFAWGELSDPIRAMFARLPAAGSTRRNDRRNGE